MAWGDTCGKIKLCMPADPFEGTCPTCMEYWTERGSVNCTFSAGVQGLYPYLPPNQDPGQGARSGHSATPEPSLISTSDTLTIPIAHFANFGWSWEAGLHDPKQSASPSLTYGYHQGVSSFAVLQGTLREFAVSPAPAAGNPSVAYIEVGLFVSEVEGICYTGTNEWRFHVTLAVCHTPFYNANSNVVNTLYTSSGNNPYTFDDYLVYPSELRTKTHQNGENQSIDNCRGFGPFDVTLLNRNEELWVWYDSVPSASEIQVTCS